MTHSENIFMPAYVVAGNDGLLREQTLTRLKKALAKYGDLAFNTDEFDGDTASGTAIVMACATLPFASDYRLVLVRHAGGLKKADSEELIDYLKNPNASTVLVLEAESLPKNTRLYKAVAALGKDAIRDCVLPKPWDMPKRVREMAPRHKITLTADAAQALYELIGDDTIHLDAALEKIALGRSSTTPVSAAEIRGEVARTAEIKPWDFTDAFIERDLAKCLEVLSCIRDSSPHALMTMTLKNIRYLMHMKSIVKEFGSPNDAVLKRFINEEYDQAAKLLELTSPQDKSAKPKRMADFTAKKIMKNQGRFSEAELRRALYAARETEKAMKSGADPDKAFERWVIDALGRRP